MALKIKGNTKKFINAYLRFFSLRWKNIFISRFSKFGSFTIIEEGTRINGKIEIKGSGPVYIGKFCAIGSDVKIITSNHNYKFLNLQFHLQKKLGAKIPIGRNKPIKIGNNVWIGDNVIILPSVEIGDGSVIGAGTVVTKDVPSYSIVVGNPGRVIKYRFDANVLKELKSLNWCSLDIETLRKYKSIFEKEVDEIVIKELKNIMEKHYDET